MIIDNNVLAISKCMFQERKNWKFVTESQKETFFFIFNRYFSKKFPHLSQLLNDKNIDKVTGMDLWFYFMEGKPYPNWFWSKSEKEKDKSELSEKEKLSLLHHLDVKSQELDLLLKFHSEELKEELKYLKEIDKGNK